MEIMWWWCYCLKFSTINSKADLCRRILGWLGPCFSRCGRFHGCPMVKRCHVLISISLRGFHFQVPSLFQRYSTIQGGRTLFLPSWLETPRRRIRDVFTAFSRCHGTPWCFSHGVGFFHPCALHPTSAHLVRPSLLSNSFQPRPVHPRCWCMSGEDLLLVMSCCFQKNGCELIFGGLGRLPVACSDSEKAWRDQRRKGPQTHK